MAEHNTRGQQAEELACQHLQAKGYTILERNTKNTFAEIDIIANYADYIVFVEVKYRARADFGGAVGAITQSKLQHMQRGALYWLSQHGQYSSLQPRLDVVTVVGDITQPSINHLENI